MTAPLHNASLELCRQTLIATFAPTETATPHKCPECGKPYVVTYGRHSKRHLAMHGINPHCPRAKDPFLRPHAVTREQALEACREACEGLNTVNHPNHEHRHP